MSSDFFERLEAELGGLTREGVHITAGRRRRRAVLVLMRAVAILTAAAALALAFDSEFAASANGYGVMAQVATVQSA